MDGPEPPARWQALFADQGLVDGRDVDLEFVRLGAAALGLQRVEILAPAKSSFALVEEAIRRAHVDVLSVVARGPSGADLMAFLEREAIPALWEVPADVEQGGLMSVIGSYDEAMRLAVSAVASILRGRHPGTIPIQEVTRIDIAINLRTARAMRLTIPSEILLRANRLFE